MVLSSLCWHYPVLCFKIQNKNMVRLSSSCVIVHLQPVPCIIYSVEHACIIFLTCGTSIQLWFNSMYIIRFFKNNMIVLLYHLYNVYTIIVSWSNLKSSTTKINKHSCSSIERLFVVSNFSINNTQYHIMLFGTFWIST